MPDNDKTQVPTASVNDAPQRRLLLRHMRPNQRPAPDPTRTAQRKAVLIQQLAQAKPLLDHATLHYGNTAIPQAQRDAFAQAREHFMDAGKQGQYVTAVARLGDYQRAAVTLINASTYAPKAAEQRAQQAADRQALHASMVPALAAAKRSSFPQGQADHIAKFSLDAGQEFKDYLVALEALEQAKSGLNMARPLAAEDVAALKQQCQTLIARAQAYLRHYDTALSTSQQADKKSLSKKRYCEEGLLQANQLMIALDFDLVPDPAVQAWDAAAEMQANSVRAKLNFHQAYQGARSLKAGGEAAGASDSLWLQGMDFDAYTPTQNKRVALFKPFEGEKAPDGLTNTPGAGAVKEALASSNAKLFAAQTGINLGVPETHVVSVNRYAIQGGGAGNPQDEVVGSAQTNAGATQDMAAMDFVARARIKRGDIQKMVILDMMQLNCDRHAGNIMVKDGADGEPEMVPIDHGGSLPKRADFAAVKERIGGISKGGFTVKVFNELLKLPGAYEAFDPALRAQLDLLDPSAMEAGMKLQLSAMDQVHPRLGAGNKLEDSSLHLSKRSMMFMKRAASMLSPAVMQIALAQRGEELFDCADSDFNGLADQVIAQFAVGNDIYRDLFTGPADDLSDVLNWLEKEGWTQGPTNSEGAVDFLLHHPVQAMKLFRAKKANAHPTPPAAALAQIADPADDATAAPPDDVFRQQYQAQFPKSNPDVQDKVWRNRVHFMHRYTQGQAAYQQMLTATGATRDESAKEACDSLVVWAELNKPANMAALAALRPTGAGVLAKKFLRGKLAKAQQNVSAALTVAQAQADVAHIDDDDVLEQGAKDAVQALQRIGADPLVSAATQAALAQLPAVHLALNNQHWQTAHDLAQAALQQGNRLALDALRTRSLAEVDAVAQRTGRKEPTPELIAGLDNMAAACGRNALSLAKDALTDLQQLIATVDTQLTLLPAFAWDPKVASGAKQQAVTAGLFKDTDTGMSSALKAVMEVQKSFNGVLGPKVSPAKKRPAGEKALAAYAKFIAFVESKLRPLSKAFAWQNFCNGAVKASTDKMTYIRGLMVNWP